jgi:hypothetical protein
MIVFLSILLFGVCKKNFLPCPVHPALLEWVHINAHWRIKGVFDNLVKFVYKLGKQEPGTPFSKLLDLHLMQQ